MKFIRYDAIKNWKSNNIEDIIDVTDEIPEKIQFAKPIDKGIDWLEFVEVDRYYDELVYSSEFQDLVTSLYLEVMKALEHRFVKRRKNLRKFMRRSTTYAFDNNYLFQALFKYLRTHIIYHYLPSYDTYSSYDTYLLEQAFEPSDLNVIGAVMETFLRDLPPASPEFRQLFGLTEYGTEEVWWDMDGKYREENDMTQVQLNIMQSTTPRTTKPWLGEHKDEIVSLYLYYWEIITSDKWEEGPTRSDKRNRFIYRIVKRPLNPSAENKYHRFMSSLLKIAENTIRKKHKMRQIKVEADEDNLSRRFRKAVFEAIMVHNASLIEVVTKKQPKVIRLNPTKISDSQKDLSTVVNMISDFVGEDDSEEEEQVEVEVTEVTEAKDQPVDENQTYKEFLRRLVKETSLSVTEVTETCRKNGMLLNAFIHAVNQFLYDAFEDQVVVVEGDEIVVDEFYIDELNELVENDFSELD